MKPCVFEMEVWLPRAREEIFQFFSEARNLEEITPAWLSFEVLTPGHIEMRAGTLIDYRIRVHGFPLRWRTEIARWEPPAFFVDVQLRGPYVLWEHTHKFEEQNGGTRCVDQVRYWPKGGALIDLLFVRRDVQRIFEFRRKKLLELFGAPARQSQC